VRTVDEHLARVLDTITELSPLDLTLLDAHACVLAEDVSSPTDLPAFDNSAMDGYAVRRDDVDTASPDAPVVLPVVGDVPAGSTSPQRVQPGLCVRIMTGAPLPAGADAVVPVEWTDGGIASVRIERVPAPAANIRRAGEDVRSGDVVAQAGSTLGAASLGLLAAVGRARLLVRPRPRVVVLSTGAELVDAGEPVGPGQLVDANSYALTAAAREAGAIAYRVGIVPDDPRRLLDVLEDQLLRADLVVTSGGVSMGAYDAVKEALGRVGTVDFARVAMQPGMPQGFGTLGEDATPIFCLPGNPVSALVSFEVFVRPALRRMLGAQPLQRPSVRAVARTELRSPAGKRQFVRAQVAVEDGVYAVRPIGGPGSHLLASMAAANALIVLDEDVTEVAAGAAVPTMLLERRAR